MNIDNWENEGGMVYPEKEELMLPYVPPWACDRWGGYEHDWLDCVKCQANYEVYLEEHEQPGGIEAYKPGQPWKPCCNKEDRNMNGGCNNCGDPSF